MTTSTAGFVASPLPAPATAPAERRRSAGEEAKAERATPEDRRRTPQAHVQRWERRAIRGAVNRPGFQDGYLSGKF